MPKFMKDKKKSFEYERAKENLFFFFFFKNKFLTFKDVDYVFTHAM